MNKKEQDTVTASDLINQIKKLLGQTKSALKDLDDIIARYDFNKRLDECENICQAIHRGIQ